VNGGARIDGNAGAVAEHESPIGAGVWERLVGCGAGACIFAFGNADAVLKSGEIAWRGLSGWQSAWCGTMRMTMQEFFANGRTRMTCRTWSSRLSLERDLMEVDCRRLADRACILGTMIVQVAEDASVPLWRRCLLDGDQLSDCRP
jgi:hypothetical protein